MIKYEGMKSINKIAHLCLSNDKNERVEIPLEVQVAERITKYISKIAPSAAPVERGNDDDLESDEKVGG